MKKAIFVLILVILFIGIMGCDVQEKTEKEEKYEYTDIYKDVKYDYVFIDEFHSIRGGSFAHFYIFSTETNKVIYASGRNSDNVNSITFGEYEGQYGKNIKITLENDEKTLYFSFTEDGRLCKTGEDYHIESYNCDYKKGNVESTIQLLNKLERE